MSIDIVCSKDSKLGPVYGEYMVTADLDGVFYIWHTNHPTPIIINIDGVNSEYRSLQSIGLTTRDFEEAPINKYGLKEVAKLDDEVLVMTANGMFVIYSGGLPSMPGLPSDIGPVSGLWINKEGSVMGYPFSLYPEIKLVTFMHRMSGFSFRPLKFDFTSTIYKITCTDFRSHEKKIINDCNYFMDSFRVSRYLNLYPGFTEASLRRYKAILNRNKFMLGSSSELKPISLDLHLNAINIDSDHSERYILSK